MKLSKVRETRDYFSTTLSTLTRQLGFAAIGIVFAFTLGQDENHVPWRLKMTSLFVVLSLAADFVFYAVGTWYWQAFQDRVEDKKALEDEHEAGDSSRSFLDGMRYLMWVKVGLMALAYVFALAYLGEFVFAD